ncbi:hypothetical protein SCUP515_12880 [Seiridium cupressi]
MSTPEGDAVASSGKVVDAEVEVRNERYVKKIGERDLKDDSLASTTNVRADYALYDLNIPVWIRPGSTSRMTIPLDLICTCKRIHSEAIHLLHRIKKHKVHVLHGPADERRQWQDAGFIPPAGARVVNLHIFTQSESLDISRLEECVHPGKLYSIAPTLGHLTITVRPLTHRPGTLVKMLFYEPLGVNPYSERQRSSEMQRVQAEMADGKVIEMSTTGWPTIFPSLPALKRFTLELEHHEVQLENLQEHALWAQKWKFPLREGLELVSRSPPSMKTWRGLRVHDHMTCVLCGRLHPSVRPQCQRCIWRAKGKGPRMMTWTVEWVARKKTATEAHVDDTV